jgi:hypothetical protein
VRGSRAERPLRKDKRLLSACRITVSRRTTSLFYHITARLSRRAATERRRETYFTSARLLPIYHPKSIKYFNNMCPGYACFLCGYSTQDKKKFENHYCHRPTITHASDDNTYRSGDNRIIFYTVTPLKERKKYSTWWDAQRPFVQMPSLDTKKERRKPQYLHDCQIYKEWQERTEE